MTDSPVPPPPPGGYRLATRQLMRACTKAALGTLLAEGGCPYVSLVTVACDQDASPLLLLSRLSDHTRNIAADARVSLLFDGTVGLANPQTGPRVTIQGRIAKTDDPGHRARFLAMHPGAVLYAGFEDFAVFRVTVERAHWVGGFGRAVWIDDQITLAPPIAHGFAEAAVAQLAEMNKARAEQIDRVAQGVLGRAGQGWRMVGFDPEGCDLALGDTVARLAFDEPLASPVDLGDAFAALARKAVPPSV